MLEEEGSCDVGRHAWDTGGPAIRKIGPVYMNNEEEEEEEEDEEADDGRAK